jgi:hypothetical protein
LICFGASTDLVDRIKKISAHVWRGLDTEPLGLLPIVLADLHAIVDQQVWTVNESVGDFEYVSQLPLMIAAASDGLTLKHTIKATSSVGEFRPNFFNDLHWVAKNIIHLKESSDAALTTCRDILDMLSSEKSTSSAHPSTKYLSTLFESTVLRTTSLEKRMQNIINLSFNLVTQRDSQHIKFESSSMHTIALTTLIFLPISTVAAIFGSQFFAYTPPPPPEGEQQPELMLSGTFWLFWAVTVPLTLIVLGLWLWKHPVTVKRWTRRSGGRKLRSKGKSSDIEKARPS